MVHGAGCSCTAVLQVLWSNAEGPNARNSTVLRVNITNSTNYWTVTFPSSGHQTINVFCYAPSYYCPLSTAPSCNPPPASKSTAKGSSSLLTAASGSSCAAGSSRADGQVYGLRVSCMHHRQRLVR